MKKISYRFGDKLRDIREKKGITLKTVANKVNVSESLISQIERNKVSPSIDTLFSIADALDIDLDYLFSDYQKKKNVTILKAKDRKKIETDEITYHQLSVLPNASDKHAIEAFIMEINKGSKKGHDDYGHTGNEFGYILSGKGKLTYGKNEYFFTAGDSIAFSSEIPHKVECLSDEPLTALWMVNPPKILFFKE
ncbi:MAG: helix-turn-helix transcriptional regulator [Spirochaetales bacterium]|nr:helix-turn-helix transcriptional regulator [Spirochaetales bacterium]